MTMLTLDAVSVTLNGTPLASLSARVAPGQVLTVMGASGSGKSALLAAIIGAAPPAFSVSGRVIVGDRDVSRLPTQRRNIGILFQDDLLFPHLSVGGNLGFGLAQGGSRSERRAIVAAALEHADLAGYADRDPATLSGGQRARVALLRTLLARPEALLLDEPFSRLDAGLRQHIRSYVLGEARLRGLAIILVTHDVEDARAAGGMVVDTHGTEVAL